MNEDLLKKHITNFWDTEITPTLIDYIKIPNKSPSFDPDWEEHGHMEKVLKLAVAWTEKNKPEGSELIIKKSPNRTPLIMLDIPGTTEGNILMYGHLDKQPEMEGWEEGLDQEELMEYAMHPQQYEDFKSGKAKQKFEEGIDRMRTLLINRFTDVRDTRVGRLLAVPHGNL